MNLIPLQMHDDDPGTPSGGNPPAPAPASPPPVQPQASSAATFTQEQLNAALAEEKRKWKKQQDEAAAKARQEAEEKAALEKGEFEKLAGERGSRLAQIETEHTTLQERHTALTEAMEAQIKQRIKLLPEEMRELLGDGDVLARYTQLGKLEAAAAKLTTVPRGPGTPPGPRPAGGNTPPAPDVATAKRSTINYDL